MRSFLQKVPFLFVSPREPYLADQAIGSFQVSFVFVWTKPPGRW